MIGTFVEYSDLQTSNNIDFAPQNVKELVGLCLTIVFVATRIYFQYVSEILVAVLQLEHSCLCENALKY